jgi:hypothetical protein
MDMYSKMDGSAPVSQILGGVWKIQKKPSTDDQHVDERKKNRKKKEEEKNFEDGRITGDNEMIMGDDAPLNNEDVKNENAPEEDSSPARHKIDITI